MNSTSSRSPSRLRFAALAVAIGSMLLACQSGDDEAAGDADADLINGKAAMLPSTIRIMDGCTAAKIGPKLLLTAAHCAFNLSSMAPKYDATHPIALWTDPGDTSAEHQVVRVEGHPEFIKKCAQTLCSISAVVAKLDAPDIAVIEIADELEGIPTAVVDPRPLQPNDQVIIEGFGCTVGVYIPDESKAPTLTAAPNRIAKPEAAVHPGSFVTAADLPVFSGNYAMTTGPGMTRTRAGLCPGDSGGPLYARADRNATGKIKDPKELVIVGVNANYTLRPTETDPLGLPVTNWHTRLDDESRNHVATWLSAQLHAGPATK